MAGAADDLFLGRALRDGVLHGVVDHREDFIYRLWLDGRRRWRVFGVILRAVTVYGANIDRFDGES